MTALIGQKSVSFGTALLAPRRASPPDPRQQVDDVAEAATHQASSEVNRRRWTQHRPTSCRARVFVVLAVCRICRRSYASTVRHDLRQQRTRRVNEFETPST